MFDHDGVVAIDGDREVIGHLAVELAHTSAADGCHLLHAPHEFVLRNHHGRSIGRHRFERML